MYYVYGNATRGWRSKRKLELAARLSALIEELTADNLGASQHAPPYVKVDWPHTDSVAIRRITSLSDEMADKLTSQADAVYKEVMNMPSSDSASPQRAIGRTFSELGSAWRDPTKQEIHLDCPSGDPRPGDLIAELIEDTGLPLRDDTGRVFGHWQWDYSDIARTVWEKAVPLIERCMAALFDRGIIRAGHCGGFTSEESLRL